MYIAKYRDKAGRPVVLMRPRNENTKTNPDQMKFLVYHLELASRLADEAGKGSSGRPVFTGCSMLGAASIWLHPQN
jgi:CRAL/TRIO domain